MSLNNTLSHSSHQFDFNMPQPLFSGYLVCEGKKRFKSLPEDKTKQLYMIENLELKSHLMPIRFFFVRDKQIPGFQKRV